MKIQTVDIKNFLALEQVTLNLRAPINIIAGANEAGKSSIRDAIQWALTGQARGFKTHAEQAHLIHDGAKAAEVSLTYGDGQTVARRKTPKSSPTVEGTLPSDLGLVAILSDPLTFLSWPDAQRRETLFRLIPGLSPTKDEVTCRLWESCKVVADLPESPTLELGGVAQPILDLAEIAATKGFKAAETEAVSLRRAAKRTRDQLQVEDPESRATIGGREYILPDIQETEVQDGLIKLRAERDKLIKQRGKVEGQIDSIPQLEADLEELKKSRFTFAELLDAQEIEDQEAALVIHRETLKRFQQDLAAAQITREAYPQFCPAIASAQVTCPKAGELLSGEPIDPAVIEELGAKVQAQKEHIEALENKLEQDASRLKAHQEHEVEIQKLETKIEDLKTKKETADATKPLDDKITALDVRIEAGQALLDAVRDFWRQKDAADQARERIDKEEAEIILYDSLAKSMAPDGIPSQLIKEALGPVNEALAQASSDLFEGCPPVELNGELEVYRGKTPYTCLSKSARYRVGICFQYALAILTGSRLLMVDEGDILDPLNRAQLIEFLLHVCEQFDTILVFATSYEAKPSPVQEIQVWWLERGRISPVMPTPLLEEAHQRAVEAA